MTDIYQQNKKKVNTLYTDNPDQFVLPIDNKAWSSHNLFFSSSSYHGISDGSVSWDCYFNLIWLPYSQDNTNLLVIYFASIDKNTYSINILNIHNIHIGMSKGSFSCNIFLLKIITNIWTQWAYKKIEAYLKEITTKML